MIRFNRSQIYVIVIAAAAGVIIAEGVLAMLPVNLNSVFSLLIRIILPVLAVYSGLWIADRLSAPANQANRQAKNIQNPDHLLLEQNESLKLSLANAEAELVSLKSELDFQLTKFNQAEQMITVNEERFRNMADNIQEGLTIIENGKLVYINQRACQIFGDCPQGTIEQRIRTFALPSEVERVTSLLEENSITGMIPAELQYWIKNKNHELRCIHEHYSSNYTEDVNRVFVVTSDITEQVQNFQSLELMVDERTRELSTVLEVSKKISSTLELEPLLNLILDEIETILPYSGAALFTMEEDHLAVIAYQVPDLNTPAHLMIIPIDDLEMYLPVILEKQVMILDDVLGRSPLALACENAGIQVGASHFSHARSWLGIPLVIRNHVAGLLSLTHGEPGYYTKNHAHLAQTIANQVAMAIENARLFEKAQNLATLEERNRIARELHDSVTQLLYGITLYCTATSRSLNSKNYQQIGENLAEIKDNALQALREMRLLIMELTPPMLQKEGLVAALKSSLDAIESRAALETELVSDGIVRLPRAIEPGLYRIAMEALNNLVRYANAQKVSVELQIRGNWVFLDIKDNGVGFNPEEARRQSGMGLVSMEQRARQLGGQLIIHSNPGEGTCIHVEVPLV